MKTKRTFWGFGIGLALVLNAVIFQTVWAQTGLSYYINPFFKDLAKQRTLRQYDIHRTANLCSSYNAFVQTIKDYLGQHTASFSIDIEYDFSFSQVGSIIDQAIDDAFEGDDYLASSYTRWATSWSGSDGDVTIDFTIDFLTTAAQEDEITQRVQEILFGQSGESGIIWGGMTYEEMEKQIHDWIVSNVAYDTSYVEHSAYAALFLGETVCQGYSLLMTRMLSDVGIESRIVVSESMNHAWNMVELCNVWYHVDATWDDPVPDVPDRILYNYYNLSDAQISSNHSGWAGYPACPDTYVEGSCDQPLGSDPLSVSAVVNIASGTFPLEVQFEATITSAIAPYTISWDFGDESDTSSAQNPSHIYTEAGTFTAVVFVEDADGDTAQDSLVIEVSQPAALDMDDPDDFIVLVGAESHTVSAGIVEYVYDAGSINTIIIERGAGAKVYNAQGSNVIQIESESVNFTISRSGSTVTLQGEDATVLRIPGTAFVQTISFYDQTLTLSIYNNQVMLNDQVVTTTAVPIDG